MTVTFKQFLLSNLAVEGFKALQFCWEDGFTWRTTWVACKVCCGVRTGLVKMNQFLQPTAHKAGTGRFHIWLPLTWQTHIIKWWNSPPQDAMIATNLDESDQFRSRSGFHWQIQVYTISSCLLVAWVCSSGTVWFSQCPLHHSTLFTA